MEANPFFQKLKEYAEFYANSESFWENYFEELDALMSDEPVVGIRYVIDTGE